jgi:hypothetical protein
MAGPSRATSSPERFISSAVRVEKGSIYILDEDGKQPKATVVGTVLKQ